MVSTIKVFSGEEFYPKPIKRWDGESWTTAHTVLKRWSGTEWLVVEPQLPPNFRFVAPTAVGDGDGSNWENAAPISALPALIAEVGDIFQGTILLASHLGDYVQTSSIALAHNPEHRVLITGADADMMPSKVTFRGNRTAWTAPETEAGAVNAAAFGGNTLFAAANGIGNLSFKNIRFERFGRIIDFSGVTAQEFLFEDCEFFNVRDGIYTSNTSEISFLKMERVKAIGFSKKCVRFHGACHDWEIIDCEIDSRWQDNDNFAVGIECNHTAHHLLIEGGFTRNSRDSLNAYWNGDGVSSENGNHHITVRRHKSTGNTDAGYDMKAENVVFEDCEANDNKRNYRIWGGYVTPLVMNNCKSLNPHWRGGTGGPNHIWTYGYAGVAANDFVASGGDEGIAAFAIDGEQGTITFVRPNVTLTPGSIPYASLQTGSQIIGLGSLPLQVPAKYDATWWTLAPNGVSGELTLTLIYLPGNGGSNITGLQYRLNNGAWLTMPGGLATGARILSGLPDGVPQSVMIRAVNAIGAGGNSDVKTRTSTGVAFTPLVNKFAKNTPAVPVANPTINLTLDDLPDRLLVVDINAGGSGFNYATSVTWTPVSTGIPEALTLLASNPGAGDFFRTSIWTKTNPTVGAGVVSVTLPGTPNVVNIAATAYYKVDTAAPLSTPTNSNVNYPPNPPAIVGNVNTPQGEGSIAHFSACTSKNGNSNITLNSGGATDLVFMYSDREVTSQQWFIGLSVSRRGEADGITNFSYTPTGQTFYEVTGLGVGIKGKV